MSLSQQLLGDVSLQDVIPQNLRQFVESYNSLTTNASAAIARVTRHTATQGDITNPEGRRAPKTIEPWTHADRELERAIIDAILEGTDGASGSLSFPSRQVVSAVGEDLVRVDTEHALLLYDSDTLHKPATRILRGLLGMDSVTIAVSSVVRSRGARGNQTLRPGEVRFPTHRNEVPAHRSVQAQVQKVVRKLTVCNAHRSGVKRGRPTDDLFQPPTRRLGPADVFCIFQPNDQRQRAELLYVKEAKAPHKFTSEIITKAVGHDRTLDTVAIMNRSYSRSDSVKELEVDECEYWFAAVCAQLYNSMLDASLRYGVITTGANYVFVSIDPSQPTILRYDVCKPPTGVSGIHESPLLRVVALALLAMHNPQLPSYQMADLAGQGGGLVWTTARENPSFYDDDRSPAAQTESYREASGQRGDGSEGNQLDSVDAPPREHGTTTNNPPTDVPIARPACPSPPSPQRKRPRSTDPDTATLPPAKYAKIETKSGATRTTCTIFHEPSMPATPTSSPPSSPAAPPVAIQGRKYCSVACLRALRHHNDLQPPCPNYADHVRPVSGTIITRPEQLRQHLKNQLQRTDGPTDCEFYLGKPGSGDALPAKIWLQSHGHVLFAKAFQADKLEKMWREVKMYNRLQPLQGKDVPVCLGAIELPSTDAVECVGVAYTGFLLLSYGGDGMDAWPRLASGIGQGADVDGHFVQSLTEQAKKALSRIHSRNVVHRDVALRNVLIRNFEAHAHAPTFQLGVQFIDFEKARTKDGYRRNAMMQRQLHGKYATDARSTEEIGDEEFAEACDKEMAWCPEAMEKWIV